jgi:hypothetical protein
MAAGAAYAVSDAGQTNWNGLTLTAVNVQFSGNAVDMIGMGGQNDTSYSSASSALSSAYILMDSTNAVPVYIDSIYINATNSRSDFTNTWEFDPLFYSVPGGLAPRAIDWYSPNAFHERQTFQVVKGTWLFKQGDSWNGTNEWGGSAAHAHMLSVQTTNVTLDESQLTLLPGWANGSFDVSLSGPFGGQWNLQASPDLLNWTSLGLITISNSPVQFSDTQATNFQQRFYRAISH